MVPVHYQEPLRVGWATWQPKAEDFVTDLRERRLFDQLDGEERRALQRLSFQAR